MENIIYANNENFDNEISTGTVVVDFYADWCGPCKMLSPILEEIAKAQPDLKIVKVDVDKYPDIAGKYEVMAMPTMKLFQEGEVINQKVGFANKSALEDWIKSR